MNATVFDRQGVIWISQTIVGLFLTVFAYVAIDRTVGIEGMLPTVGLALVVLLLTEVLFRRYRDRSRSP